MEHREGREVVGTGVEVIGVFSKVVGRDELVVNAFMEIVVRCM